MRRYLSRLVVFGSISCLLFAPCVAQAKWGFLKHFGRKNPDSTMFSSLESITVEPLDRLDSGSIVIPLADHRYILSPLKGSLRQGQGLGLSVGSNSLRLLISPTSPLSSFESLASIDLWKAQKKEEREINWAASANGKNFVVVERLIQARSQFHPFDRPAVEIHRQVRFFELNGHKLEEFDFNSSKNKVGLKQPLAIADDGKTIAYIDQANDSVRSGRTKTEKSTFSVLARSSLEPRIFTVTGLIRYLDFVPNGKQILVQSSSGLHLVDYESGRIQSHDMKYQDTKKLTSQAVSGLFSETLQPKAVFEPHTGKIILPWERGIIAFDEDLNPQVKINYEIDRIAVQVILGEDGKIFVKHQADQLIDGVALNTYVELDLATTLEGRE